MNDIAIARAIHVLAVVIWIGGVAMVTTVVLPLIRRTRAPREQLALFEAVERRFIWQARIAVLLVGASGLYMVEKLDLWDRYRSLAFWWMHAMAAVWAIFAIILFIAEPLIVDRWVQRRAEKAPESTFCLLHGLHWVLLAISLITAFAAVAGSYGMSLVP